MKFNATEEKENKLLHRKEVKGILTYEKETPAKEQLQLNLASHYGADKELVVIERIRNIFGARQASICLKVYETPESLKKYEKEPKKKEAKAAGAAPAEEKAKKPKKGE